MPEELAAKLQAALAVHDVSDGGGMSATVMTAEGTWSGTTGKADGVRDLQVDDQFTIASITKSVVAAQVMLMVEAGELGLDDLVADHLPEDIQFDTDGVTIRQLLGHRSGLPDYYELGPLADIQTDPQRVWTPTEVLALMPTERTAPGSSFSYAETNYLLLKLVIEHRRGRPLADVLRDGALAVDGLERLVVQPDESPTEPMAMPAGASDTSLERMGGYLPSLANATAYQASGGIASDSASLAQWWRALCGGEIVSQASLTEMSTFEPADYLGGYGLGMYNPANGYGHSLRAHRTIPRLHVVGRVPARGRSGDRRAHQSRSRRRPPGVLPRIGASARRRSAFTLTSGCRTGHDVRFVTRRPAREHPQHESGPSRALHFPSWRWTITPDMPEPSAAVDGAKCASSIRRHAAATFSLLFSAVGSVTAGANLSVDDIVIDDT